MWPMHFLSPKLRRRNEQLLIKVMFHRVLILLFVCACWSMGRAEEVQAQHARVELVSRQTSFAPGQENLLGVHFSLEKDWHIYWINPGDSGQPPVLHWQLPAGFNAGEIQWPHPEKLQKGSLADYGYNGQVTLLVPVRVSKSYQGNANAEIGLQARWLICREVCIPDHVQLRLTLSSGGAPAEDQKHSALFTETQKLLPQPWPRSWKAHVASEKDTFILSVQTGKAIPKAEFFPLEANQIENAAPQTVKTTSQGAEITMSKSDQLLKPISNLKGVLVLADGNAYQIQASVTQH